MKKIIIVFCLIVSVIIGIVAYMILNMTVTPIQPDVFVMYPLTLEEVLENEWLSAPSDYVLDRYELRGRVLEEAMGQFILGIIEINNGEGLGRPGDIVFVDYWVFRTLD